MTHKNGRAGTPDAGHRDVGIRVFGEYPSVVAFLLLDTHWVGSPRGFRDEARGLHVHGRYWATRVAASFFFFFVGVYPGGSAPKMSARRKRSGFKYMCQRERDTKCRNIHSPHTRRVCLAWNAPPRIVVLLGVEISAPLLADDIRPRGLLLPRNRRRNPPCRRRSNLGPFLPVRRMSWIFLSLLC